MANPFGSAFGKTPAAKTSTEASASTTTPQAPPPAQPFAFKIPAIPDNRRKPDTASNDDGGPFNVAPAPEADEGSSKIVPPSSFAFSFGKPAATQPIAEEGTPSGAKRSRADDTDIQAVLAKPSFFDAPKPAASIAVRDEMALVTDPDGVDLTDEMVRDLAA